MVLPRGKGFVSDAALATADWADDDLILSHVYEPGDLWLGRAPTLPNNIGEFLQEIDAYQAELEAEILLNPEWRMSQIAEIQSCLNEIRENAAIDIGVKPDSHLVTVAGSRAGKGTSAIIPNLCLYPGSVVVIDPKGENASLTATRRGHGSANVEGLGQRVCVLDPYGKADVPDDLRASFNPLSAIDRNSSDAIDQAGTIADALILKTGGGDSVHFDETARQFLKGLILHVITDPDLGDPDLLTVRKCLSQGDIDGFNKALETRRAEDPEFSLGEGVNAFEYLLTGMLDNTAYNGVIVGAARVLIDMGDKERGSVLSTARRNTEFLDSPDMRQVLRHSTLETLAELKTSDKGLTLYLCLPAERMQTHGRWLRLMITLSLEAMYKSIEAPKSGHPVLFLLEEFASLGHLDMIEKAAGYAAGFGVKLWAILQDLTQLKKNYAESWETFLGNASVVQIFGNSDMTTLEYMSKRLGEIEIVRNVENVSTSMSVGSNDPSSFQKASSLLMQGGPVGLMTSPFMALLGQSAKGQNTSTTSSLNQTVQKTPLLAPDEIERVFSSSNGLQLVFIKGLAPFAVPRVPYFAVSQFSGLYEPQKPDKNEFQDVGSARRAAHNDKASRDFKIKTLVRNFQDKIAISREQRDKEKARGVFLQKKQRARFWCGVIGVSVGVIGSVVNRSLFELFTGVGFGVLLYAIWLRIQLHILRRRDPSFRTQKSNKTSFLKLRPQSWSARLAILYWAVVFSFLFYSYIISSGKEADLGDIIGEIITFLMVFAIIKIIEKIVLFFVKGFSFTRKSYYPFPKLFGYIEESEFLLTKAIPYHLICSLYPGFIVVLFGFREDSFGGVIVYPEITILNSFLKNIF